MYIFLVCILIFFVILAWSVLALEKCQALNSSVAMRVFVQEMLNLHRGQGQDIFWRDRCICPSEAQYRQMVKDKTGGLFRLAVGLMQAFSSNSTDFTSLLDDLALYFQIRDDLLNITRFVLYCYLIIWVIFLETSSSYMQSKSFCEDLTEGKFSYPVIHTILNFPHDTRLSSILRQRTEDVDVKRHAVMWMEHCGSLEYTRTELRRLKQCVLEDIDRLGGHEKLVKFVEKLDEELVQQQLI